MAEHYTRNTAAAEAWCRPCGRPTMHRIDGTRLGPCLNCIARREAEARANAAQPKQPEQQNLFTN
jgi:hypothetical protein